MSSRPPKRYAIAILLLITQFAYAQKGIVISDSLAAHSDKLVVKLGGQGLGKVWKMHFGEFGVISSKNGWTTTSSHQGLFDSKTESKSTSKFSFVLGNGTNDTAWINAANNITVQSLRESWLFRGLFNDELVQQQHNFSSFISINHDTSETWSLLVNIMTHQDSLGNYEAFLTNGERKIFIVPVGTGDKKGNAFSMPAAGYEFFEAKQSLCALQYYGGGPMGLNKNIVWLRKELDPKMKLVLAAAATAILEMKTLEYESQ